ncbi:MAG: hypothetical protein ACK4WC_03750 [Rubrimonas sp.]
MGENAESKTAAPKDDMAAFRAKADRYGPAYAIFSEGLQGRGVDRVVAAVKFGIGAAALFVIGSAVLNSLG